MTGNHSCFEHSEESSEAGLRSVPETCRDRVEQILKEDQPKKCREFRVRAEQILKEDRLDERTTFFVKMLQQEVGKCLDWKDQKGFLFASISKIDGLQIWLPELFGSDDQKLVRNLKKNKTELL